MVWDQQPQSTSCPAGTSFMNGIMQSLSLFNLLSGLCNCTAPQPYQTLLTDYTFLRIGECVHTVCVWACATLDTWSQGGVHVAGCVRIISHPPTATSAQHHRDKTGCYEGWEGVTLTCQYTTQPNYDMDRWVQSCCLTLTAMLLQEPQSPPDWLVHS